MTSFEKGVSGSKSPTEANSIRAVFDNIARSEIAERVRLRSNYTSVQGETS